MASWVAKLQSMFMAMGFLLALVHLHSTWLGGEADASHHVESFVPGGVAGSQGPRRTLLQTKVNQKIRAVNLGGWLVLEGWMKPDLFSPSNLPGVVDPDLLDGFRITLKNTVTGLYIAAEDGGGSTMKCDRTVADLWETFKIVRMSPGFFALRVFKNQYVRALENGGGNVDATAPIPREWETFVFQRKPYPGNSSLHLIHIKAGNGMYFQAKTSSQLTADFAGTPGWDNNAATFIMEIVGKMEGEYQLSNAWGPGAPQAQQALTAHRDSFVVESDFLWMKNNYINAVRIPVGWWIAYDPNPPSPFVSGSLQRLDAAFTWGNKYGIKIIIDLHAAPGSQNGQEHSGSRDGVAEWGTNSTYRTQTIKVIDFLTKRYANNSGLKGIELLNEPFEAAIPDVKVLDDFYKLGYQTVRKYTKTAFVILSQGIGGALGSSDEIVRTANLLPDDRVVIDIHPYNLFGDYFKTLSVQGNINYVNTQRRNFITRLNQTKAYVLVGEWTGYFDCCNGVEEAKTKNDYLNFGTAEENVFGTATFGWAYWSYRHANDRWSYKTSVTQGYLPPRPTN